jgi:tRNA(adenine34) deaminase
VVTTALDEHGMRLALAEAEAAIAHEDVPVGAVLLDSAGRVVGRGHNRREEKADPTAHAELEALRQAAVTRGGWRLGELTMYVTLEPCPMCAGALVNARIGRLVYGCQDDRAGAVDSLFAIGRDPRLNHRFPVTGGVLAADCREQLQRFFRERRGRPGLTAADEDEAAG